MKNCCQTVRHVLLMVFLYVLNDGDFLHVLCKGDQFQLLFCLVELSQILIHTLTCLMLTNDNISNFSV